jgi:2'-5' RNA ligase
VAAAAAVLEVQNGAAAGAVSGAGVKPVSAANFHLTLAFLGSVPVSRLGEVEQVAAGFVKAFRLSELPIEIVLDAIEHWRKAQVLVATASETPADAVTLAEGLQRTLVDAGFSPDLKPFRVHATVARKVRRVARELHLESVRWSFDSLHLVESETHPDGSAYRTVKKWVLDKRD